MATSTTYGTFLDRLIRELGIGLIVPNGSFDAAAAGSITSANILRDSNYGTGHFQGLDTVIYRGGAASSADYERFAGALTTSTGLLAHTGANYSDTTTTSESVRLLYHRLRPAQELLDAANRVLEFIFRDSFEALSHRSDLDYAMTDSTDTQYTDVGTPTTSAKDTTARRTPWGTRNYHLINDADGEGTQTATVGAEEGSMVSAWAIASRNAGTSAELQLYNVTGSADFSSVEVTSDEEEPMLLSQPWIRTPTDSKEIALRLVGNGAAADIFWNMAWLYKQNVLRVNLPSHINEGFKIGDIYQCHPRSAIATNNVYQAQDLNLEKLYEGKDYDWLMNQDDANPHAVIFKDSSYFTYPLILQTRRPYSDSDSFTTDASTSKVPVHLFMPRWKMEVLSTVLMPRQPNVEKWATMFGAAQAEWVKASKARPKSPAATRPYYGGPMAGMA